MSNLRERINRLSTSKRELLDALLSSKGINASRSVIAPRARKTNLIPLSFAQQRLWFLDQMEPGTSTYNIPSSMWLGAGLDIGALERSISQVVARHEVLRTTFSSIDGKPLQVIEAPHPVELPVIDLSSLHEGSRQREAAEVVREEANRGFDLEAGPLLRAKLITEGENRHALLLTMHHIISDGWSMQVLMKEVGELYEGNIRGEESKLKELEIQYADYAMWQREWLSGEVMERELEYWKKHLEGAPAVLEMPTDRVRAAMRSTRGGMVEVRLSKEVSDKLRRLSRQEGATMYMALLAVYKMMLARYSGKRDIVVGTPVAGRNRVETEGLIGFFVNTLALRTEVEGERSYREMLRKVKEVVLEGQGHQEVPFEKLVEEMSPERSLSYTPVFQVMFAVNNIDQTGRGETGGESGGARGAERWSEERDAKFDLTLSMRDTGGGEIEGMVEYSADLYDEETIRRMGSHYERLLESAVENPDRRVCELEMMREEEKKMIVEEWNETRRPYERDKSISEMVENQAAVLPEAIAVVSGKQRLTYDELNRRANQLGRYLRERGVGPEHRVGICVERSIEMVVGLLGILKAGGAYVPMDPAYPKQRLEYMAEDAGISLLLTQESLLAQMPEHGAEVVRLETAYEQIAAESDANLQTPISGENLAYIIYTSGSTGMPKGVAVTHQAISRLVCNTDYVKLEPADRVAQASNSSFDAATFELWGALTQGARLVIIPKEIALSAEEFSEQMRQHRISTIFLTTALFNEMSRRSPEVFRTIKQVLFGGEAADAQSVKRALEQGRPQRLLHVYGPTESTTFATWKEVSRVSDEDRSVLIGKPIANTEVYILDERQQAVPIGVGGELCISGEGLARGYFNRPELTAEKFVPNNYSKQAGARLYRTGDLARFRANSEIEYLGRIDQQVKIRGYRIELGEIEAALRQHPSIKEAVVIASQEGVDRGLVAYVVDADGKRASDVDLRNFLKQSLPDYMLPSAIVRLESLPLTVNGKIDRKALPAPDMSRQVMEPAYRAPRDHIEFHMTQVWEEVIGHRRVGIKDNFFEIGGHSILAVRLIARINQVFNKSISLQALFHSPTVEDMSRRVRQGADVESESVLMHIGREGALPPFFCVHPGGGNVFCYASLAHYLGPDQPFIGIQSPGLTTGAILYTDVASMAARYIEELRTVQSEGPYFLGGWSMGGVVAFEMSRQLLAAGQDIALLALIDSRLAAAGDAKLDDTSLLTSFAHDLALTMKDPELIRHTLSQVDVHAGLADIVEAARQAEIVPSELAPEQIGRLFDVFKTNARAMSNYTPTAIPVRASLFTADQHDERRNDEIVAHWSIVTDGNVEIYKVPGTHYTIMREPQIAVLAEHLRSCLRRAQAVSIESSDLHQPERYLSERACNHHTGTIA